MSPARVLLATRNQGKVRELQVLLADLGIQVESLDEHPEVGELREDGDTFEANALQKAEIASAASGLPCVADDSGLEVDALDGRPGVLSARYAETVQARNAKLLDELADVPPERRTARFRCVMAYVHGSEEPIVVSGACEGRIARQPRGDNGFGYDPVFLLDDGRTMAMLSAEDKNAISHRGRAARKLVAALRDR